MTPAARLTLARRVGAESAIVSFVTSKDSRRLKRDRGASILTPSLNPDLRDDLVDLVADVLLWAKALGLDSAYVARVALSHVTPEALADDAAAQGEAHCNCDDSSWYGATHQSACQFAGEPR